MERKNELENFLTRLSDHELSIFIGYRFDDFLEESKKKIISEAKKRNLTKEKIEQLSITRLEIENNDKSLICSQCGSSQTFTETDYDQEIRHKYLTAEVAIETKRCRLCGFNPGKTNPKNLYERLKRLFRPEKTKKMVRIIDWY